jgi:hypothetical protein
VSPHPTKTTTTTTTETTTTTTTTTTIIGPHPTLQSLLAHLVVYPPV